LNLYSVINGSKALFEDQIFVKQDYEKFLQIAFQKYASPALQSLINVKPLQDFYYDMSNLSILERANPV
jgi:hypothetical protein